jgi:hypothetical protein
VVDDVIQRVIGVEGAGMYDPRGTIGTRNPCSPAIQDQRKETLDRNSSYSIESRG